MLIAAALLAALPGCAVLPTDRPVTVLVRDAETQKPIMAADVTIACPLTKSLTGSSIARGTTEAEGLARLRAAPINDSVTLMQTEAPGYLGETRELSPEAIAAIDRPGWFESLDRRPPSFTVDLYALPRPQAELTVPVGFRGTIKVRTEIEIADAASIGQRRFRYPVSGNGDAVVVGPAILRQLLASDYSAKYADGVALVRNPKDGTIGFWWLRKETNVDVFFVGTEAECKVALDADKITGSGGRSGGRSRRGRP
ncbi:MAG TPA: hypothetical protein VHR72_11975 [Gemmataceae bacterium]|nr:hypothetical protein [Gemmataceae bacterium]